MTAEKFDYLGEYEKQFAELCKEHKIDVDKKGYDKLEALGIDDYFKPLIVQLQDFIKSSDGDTTFSVGKWAIKLYAKKEEPKKEEEEKTEIEKGEPKKEILEILKNPDLFNEITEKEFEKRIVGEEKTRKAIFLSLCYIWLDNSEIPIDTIVTSESSAGKSYICKQIYKIFPEHLKDYRTKISPEAFTYWHNSTFEPAWNWNGKICYLEDIRNSVINSDAFKIMCSEGSISTIVIKQRAIDIKIEGKPIMLITTATTNPSSEVLNRFNLISCDESEEQTKAITRRQARKSFEGKTEEYNPKIKEALSLLKRRVVRIPFAIELQYYLEKSCSFNSLRLRRDFPRLLDLICCSTTLHQYQREEDGEGNLLATEQDYEIARECIEIIKAQTFLSLTHRLKKALDCCKELNNQEQQFPIYDKEGKVKDSVLIIGFTAKDIHSKFPFVNLKMWYNYLDELSERGLLTTTLEKTPDAKSRVTYYHIIEQKSFNLPEPKQLTFFTNLTIITNHTNDTIITNDIENKSNDCNNCNDCIAKTLIQTEKISSPEPEETENAT